MPNEVISSFKWNRIHGWKVFLKLYSSNRQRKMVNYYQSNAKPGAEKSYEK
jgi:hypothetical protein